MAAKRGWFVVLTPAIGHLAWMCTQGIPEWEEPETQLHLRISWPRRIVGTIYSTELEERWE